MHLATCLETLRLAQCRVLGDLVPSSSEKVVHLDELGDQLPLGAMGGKWFGGCQTELCVEILLCTPCSCKMS